MADISSKLQDLTDRIINYEIDTSKIKHPWGGADVIIAPEMTADLEKWLGDKHLVISDQDTIPRRRVVITEYWKELSWLFNRVKVILADHIDYVTKYDFYGRMADAANRFIGNNKEYEDKDLLLATLWEVRRYYHD